jgi:hypothetical protein
MFFPNAALAFFQSGLGSIQDRVDDFVGTVVFCHDSPYALGHCVELFIARNFFNVKQRYC